tara:strand:- start:8866 stop:11184 length:2319 start_codon:yes stop_codon:yes gene_type:complete
MSGIRHTPTDGRLNLPGSQKDSGTGVSGKGISTALEGTKTLTIGNEGMRPEDIPAWREIFVPYKNLATDAGISERALGFATQVFTEHDEATQGIRDIWFAIDMLYRGRTLAPNPEGVHLAEIYKAIETLAPRLEDPFLESDPWFAVNGRTSADRDSASKIEALLDYQLDRNKFMSRIIPESSRSILKKNHVIAKTRWDHQVKRVVRRNPKREIIPAGKGGGSRFTFRREEKDEIVYEGPRVDFVNPWWFIIDPKDPNPQTTAYVGDVQDMTYDEIATLGEQGVFVNWRDLEEQSRQESPNITETQEAATMSTAPYSYLPENRMVEGGVRKFHVLELWCRYDAFGEGRTREFVITVANWRTVLRVQENFYDDKHRPYAEGRISKDSFDFYGVGPIQHCVPIQTALDTHHQIAQKAHELSAFPPIISNDDTFDESWWDIEPGQIIPGNPAATQQMRLQSSLRDIGFISDQMRREMEEIAGAPRSFAGTEDASQTATQYQGRIEEGNRRTRGVIMSLAGFYEEIVVQFHALNRQFMSKSQAIRVLGRSGATLGNYAWLGPDDIDADVSVEITALRGLQQRGMKATNATQLLQILAPFVQGSPGVADMPALMKIAVDGLMGPGLGREIIKGPAPTSELLDQGYETTIMLREGKYIDVHPQDDDVEHMMHLEAIFDEEEFESLEEAQQQILFMHYAAHKAQEQSKQARMSGPDNFVPESSASSMVAPGQGTAPGDLAQAQPTPGQTPGETPGPVSMGRQAIPGREQPVPQTQNNFGQ